MSDTNPVCYQCDTNAVGQWGQICDPCLGAVVKAKQDRAPQRTVQATLIWAVLEQASGGVTPSGKAIFTSKVSLDDAVQAAMTCLGTHHADSAESAYGDQTTLVENGTVSVDYQGTREGGGVFWVDIQGQAGKSSSRYTLFQIMVQTHPTAMPSLATVRDAISRSFKGVRCVIRYDTTRLPK